MDCFAAVTLPGALAFGALLGWSVARLGRRRLPIALALSAAAVAANAVFSGVVDWAAGDPMRVHARSLSDGVAAGVLGIAILWWVLLPTAVVVGSLLTLVTRNQKRPNAATPAPVGTIATLS